MSDHDPSPSGENALRDALNDMDVALGAHGRTHVPVKTISDWIEHARQRVAALAAAPRDRTCAVCGRVETEDLNDPTRCRSRLLREGGSPFFDDLCLRAGPQLRAAAQRDRPQTDLQRLLGVMEEVSARLPDEDAPRDRPDARGPGFAQCWCGPGMAPDHEGPHLPAAAPRDRPDALVIEFDKEDDGRWIADIPAHPGVMAYGLNKGEALTAVVRVLCGSLEEQKSKAAPVARLGAIQIDCPEEHRRGSNLPLYCSACVIALAEKQSPAPAASPDARREILPEPVVCDFGDEFHSKPHRQRYFCINARKATP